MPMSWCACKPVWPLVFQVNGQPDCAHASWQPALACDCALHAGGLQDGFSCLGGPDFAVSGLLRALLTVAGQFITAFTAWFGLIFVLQKVEAIDGFTKGQESICYAVIMLSFSFFTVESLQFLDIFTYGARDFGRYPFLIYGEKVLKFLTCVIPLALVQYYPLLYLTDRETNGFYALCPVLALLFLVPCVAFFYYGVRKYKSTGS